MVSKGEGMGKNGLGVWDSQMQTITHRMGNNKVLLGSTENYIQYPVINHNGKECIYIYIYVCVHNI